MKREILFRGQRPNGQWVYGSLINTTHGIKHRPKQHTKTWIVVSSFGNGGWFNVIQRYYVKPETVGQYTGLIDKNGNKIFEGMRFKVWLIDEVEKDGGFWWNCEVKKHLGCWILAQVGFDYSKTPMDECELLFETDYELIPVEE